MRVTFVLPYPGLQGGVRVIAIYAERLKRRGHEVVVVARPNSTPLRRKIKSFLLGHGWPGLKSEPSYFGGTGVVPKILDRARPVTDDDLPDADVVVATWWETAEGVLNLSPSKGAKAIFIQNYEVPEGTTNPRLDATWRMPMHKITISKYLVELARERFGDPLVSHVPNSVDLRQFNAALRGKQPVPTVGMLYSKSWFKGCATSFGALERVVSEIPSLRMVCFGAHKPDPTSLRLPRFAEFHYRPPQSMLKDLYARCDVWMCGSNREGFHLPPLEAMACRCPVVSTRVGGPMDIIEEGVNGHLVEIGDAAQLAEKVVRVLRMPAAGWARMSEAAYSTAERYTWDDATLLFEEALNMAIERRRRGEFREPAAASRG